MSAITTLPLTLWSGFIDAAARGCEAIFSRGAGRRRVLLSEGEDGRFTATRVLGSESRPLGTFEINADGALVCEGRAALDAMRRARVDLEFRPGRFLFRDLPLPPQAGEFLDPIIRNQIDRLTPWPTDRAIFGHSRRESTPTKLIVSVAAADRLALQPAIDAVAALKPRALHVFAGASPADGMPTIELMRRGMDAIKGKALRRALAAILLLMGASVGGAMGYSAWERMGLDDTWDSVQSRIARQRAALRVVDAGSDPGLQLLTRKVDGPVATLVIEDLTKLLPDNTSLSEFEIAGPKIRFSGVSADAAALIGLVEKSDAFSNATFSAPTTRDAREPGEKFHIEADIRPRLGRKS